MDTFVDVIALTAQLELHVTEEGAVYCLRDKSPGRAAGTLERGSKVRCRDDVALLTNATADALLVAFDGQLGFWRLEEHFLAASLAPMAGVEVRPAPGIIGGGEPVTLGVEDPMGAQWVELREEHELGIVPPSVMTDFSTTSYENYVIEEPDLRLCRLERT